MKKLYSLFLMVALVFCSCAEEKEKETAAPEQPNLNTKKETENLNISILLDLSDRIDTIKYHMPSMEQHQRDAAYIQTVAGAYVNHMRQKKIRTLNDKIAIYFDPEPHNSEINKISKDLKFQVTRNNATLEIFDEIEKVYAEKPHKIYELALKDGKYVGSDTWGFFRNKVKDYCMEEGYRNILVILTDGYMYHKDNMRKEGNHTSYLTPQEIKSFGLNKANWQEKVKNGDYGFIPATEELEELEVIVLGINPDPKNPYEDEVIRKYWSDWFDKMEVARYDINTNSLPSNMDKIIKDFILNQ
jgi:hypothetical protein